jgi:hypothetical protein
MQKITICLKLSQHSAGDSLGIGIAVDLFILGLSDSISVW